MEEEIEKFENEQHSLFKKKIKKQYVKNEDNTFTEVQKHNLYRFFIGTFEEYGNGLHEILNDLMNAQIVDELEVIINSNGGRVDEGMQFYHVIKSKFNGKCTTVLNPKGYSMGALTFCFGDKRVANEFSEIMFHTYSQGMYGKSGEIEARNSHSQKYIKNFFDKLILKNKFLTKKEVKQLHLGKDFWFDTVEMCKRGICTHVNVNGEEIPAKKYLKGLK